MTNVFLPMLNTRNTQHYAENLKLKCFKFMEN